MVGGDYVEKIYPWGWSDADAFDIGAEREEFFIDVFVAAINVVEAGDFGGSFCAEGGEDEGGGGTEIGCHDGRS